MYVNSCATIKEKISEPPRACPAKKTTNLDLERRLQARRVLVPASHDEERPLLAERRVRQRLELVIVRQDLLDLPGKLVESVDDGVPAFGEGDPVLGELNRHHDEGDVLARVGLGRSDSDLGSGVDVDPAVRFARDGRSDDVDDSDVESSALEAVAHREDRVGRLARLGDKDADVVAEDGRLAVEEVGGELDRDGDFGELLEDGTRLREESADCLEKSRGTNGEARVVGSPARDKDNPPAATNDAEVRLESSERDGVRVEVDASAHRVDDRFGLLVDLLLHEVIKRSLHDCSEFDLESFDSPNSGDAIIATEAVDVELCNGASSSAPALLPPNSSFENAPPSAMWAMSSSSR